VRFRLARRNQACGGPRSARSKIVHCTSASDAAAALARPKNASGESTRQFMKRADNACSASLGVIAPSARCLVKWTSASSSFATSRSPQRYLRVHPEDDHEDARVALLQNLVEEVEPQLDDERLKFKTSSLAVFPQASPKRPTFRRVGHGPCPFIVILI
jgi:hypothetical protein